MEEKKEVNRIATIVNKHLLGRRIDEGSDMYAIGKDIIQELEQELDRAREEGWRDGIRYRALWAKSEGEITDEEERELLKLSKRYFPKYSKLTTK